MFRSTLSSLREYITPVSHVSTFRETGEITPEEFVLAGDYLVYKFPTWSWASAPPNKRRSFLPPDKQYLITKHVPSHHRASTFESIDTKLESLDDDPDGWTATSFGQGSLQDSHDNDTPSDPASHNSISKPDTPDENIIDIEDIEDDDDEDESAFIPSKDSSNPELGSDASDNSIRSYNLFITYSTSYRVPKLYLSGYSANGTPLSPQQMFEDIMADYRNKTATIEKAPFEDDLTSVSIHPCRHASVMKTLLSRAEARRVQKLEEQSKSQAAKAEDDWEEIEESDSQGAIRVDQYLVVFLKFISSVTPGIEHDNTMSVL